MRLISIQLPFFEVTINFIIFSSELSDCDSSNQEGLSSGDANVPRWPYRFEAITKTSSPLRNAIQICNEEVFPLPSGICTKS